MVVSCLIAKFAPLCQLHIIWPLVRCAPRQASSAPYEAQIKANACPQEGVERILRNKQQL
jgi:hypothetical protein